MSHVAIVTDSASDMAPARAAELGISLVPLVVNFGPETFKAGIELSTDDFWRDHQRYVAAGVVFEEEPRVEEYGTVAVFRDPLGNRWDLIQPA